MESCLDKHLITAQMHSQPWTEGFPAPGGRRDVLMEAWAGSRLISRIETSDGCKESSQPDMAVQVNLRNHKWVALWEHDLSGQWSWLNSHASVRHLKRKYHRSYFLLTPSSQTQWPVIEKALPGDLFSRLTSPLSVIGFWDRFVGPQFLFSRGGLREGLLFSWPMWQIIGDDK